MRTKQHHQTADDLDAVAEQHDLALGLRVRVGPDEGCKNHVEQGKHGHQRGLLPFGCPAAAQQLHRAHEQGVVCQRAEELR